METKPLLKIDVVIPTYNASKYIAETIESVLAQTHLPNKIIVVDDGSTDNTVEIIKNFNCEFIDIVSIPNSGVSRARNIGINYSQADYIAFLDSDDLWEPEKLAAQVKALGLNPDKNAVYSYATMVDENGEFTENAPSYLNLPYPPGGIPEKILFDFMNISGSASSVMLELNILKSTGFFDEKMQFFEDIDLWIRVALMTDFACVTENHVKIRVNLSSTTRSLTWSNKKRMIADHFYYMNKHADHFKFPIETINISLRRLTRPFRQTKNEVRKKWKETGCKRLRTKRKSVCQGRSLHSRSFMTLYIQAERVKSRHTLFSS